ncbi:MAG TPA: amino acid adenylation domain-containing protein, partial [Symbiobacteriaceae bacterium]|nr:amino acid adenylation domain-containing protein [Symbiobacteriaceae bacterium]
ATVPLSFSQRRLWFLEQMQPGTSVHHLYLSHWLEGRLDTGALEAAFTEIVRRHEVLRTTFGIADGEPVQVVGEAAPVSMPITDLTHLPEDNRESEAIWLAGEDHRRPMDLARGPLFRPALYRVSVDRHLLLVTVHHLIWDGWCEGLLMQELSALYGALAAGQPSALPDLPVQYGDYALWQQSAMEQETLQRQLAYWKQQLAGKLPILQLPTDRPRPALKTYRGGGYPLRFPLALLERLHAFSRKEGATLFMTLEAAWATLLHRYSGQDDILVGTPIAGRTRKELEHLAGFFVNNLVLRNNLSGDPSFRELLARVREVALGSFANQDLPFEKLVEELQPERKLSHTPLFQVMFTMESYGEAQGSLPGLTLGPARVETRSAQFDLMLYMQERSSGLLGFVEYNADLFDESTIARMIAHFGNLLEAAVANPEERIGSLALLSEAERRQILTGWNDTRTDYPLDHCLHELVEAQVDRTPDAVAVAFEGHSLTYRELNQRANQLAHCLRRHGVGPDVLVGICVERSLEMVVGLLGVLKAGGAYVPLDPSYPHDRLAHMLSDSGVGLLLTQQHLLQRLPAHTARAICLDTDWAPIAQESDANPASGAGPENLAYMIYTSGSTGKPKGALNAHRGICNRLLWMQDEYGLNETDRVLQKTPFSFDVSVWEFFWPLLTGATLVVARPGGHQDAAHLVSLIQSAGITTLHFVPSMLQAFLEEPGVEACSTLRRVICSGEALPYDLQERFFSRLESAELHNLYGPTEAAVDVTYWACQRHSDRQIVPIGRPVANTQIYILDKQMQPVPVMVPGELHIGGVQVGRGYWRRPELTAERFISDPFGGGERLYKTGDLARFLPDGTIEYLGRLDQQVKIRGFRIELGEIEATLEAHPAVRQALVTVYEPAENDRRLAAYLVPHAAADLSIDQIRAFLRERLPEYMVPSAFVPLDAMPLTPNGKVDRKALPAPTESQPAAGRAYEAPQGRVEQTIAGVWQEVLRVERVGVNENFFDLGGHSLLLVKVLHRLQELLKPDLTIVDLFNNPTVTSLAKHLGEANTGSESLQEARGRAERQKQALLRQKQLAERRRTDG